MLISKIMEENINPSTNLNPLPSPAPTVENLPTGGGGLGFDKKWLVITIVLAILILVLSLGGYYFLVMQPQQTGSPTAPAVTSQPAPVVKEETVGDLYNDINSLGTNDTSEDFTASDTAGL